MGNSPDNNERPKNKGDMVQQRLALREVLMADPKNVEAWYQMAFLLSEPERIRYCLEQVIALDPQHQDARNWLERIQDGDKANNISLPEAAEWIDVRCVYIGLLNDPESLMAYPSPGNYCHRTGQGVEVKLDHQKLYCLADAHTRCPIFIGRDPSRHVTKERKPILNPLASIKRART